MFQSFSGISLISLLFFVSLEHYTLLICILLVPNQVVDAVVVL